MKQKKEIKCKMVNHCMQQGKKQTSEKILVKSLKKLNKQSKKQTKKLVQLSILNTIPVFKLHIRTNKKRKKKNSKEIPAFIFDNNKRISLAVKFILQTVKKKQTKQFYNIIQEEILSNSKFESLAIKQKNNLQTQIILNERYFSYYRWK